MSGIDTCLIYSHPVTVTAKIQTYHLAHDGPGLQMPVGYNLAFRLGGRVISRMDYPRGPAITVLEGPLLDEPLRLALRAQKSAGRERGLLRIAIAAELPNDVLEAIAMDADRVHPEGMALWDLPEGRLGLSLGERWWPASPDVLAEIPGGPDMFERMREFEAACRPFFHRILYGDPAKEIDRLLQSL